MTVYLLAYNFFSALGWGALLFKLLSSALNNGSFSGLGHFAGVIDRSYGLLCFLLATALLEVRCFRIQLCVTEPVASLF